jgi:hypothetical protein
MQHHHCVGLLHVGKAAGKLNTSACQWLQHLYHRQREEQWHSTPHDAMIDESKMRPQKKEIKQN